MKMIQITKQAAAHALTQSGKEFLVLFERANLSVEIYQPDRVDNQKPHERDEFYLIISGSGKFIHEDEVTTFQPGDFLFVPKQASHRFTDFSEDFATWVFFIAD